MGICVICMSQILTMSKRDMQMSIILEQMSQILALNLTFSSKLLKR
jgi:hypothetical protein